jgi:hypothetical protein
MTRQNPRLADWPSTEHCKPASTLPPQVSTVLIWPVFASVARVLFSNSPVVEAGAIRPPGRMTLG